jgi:hypothetical protein
MKRLIAGIVIAVIPACTTGPTATRPASAEEPATDAAAPSGTIAPLELPELRIVTSDYAFEMPESTPGGMVKVTVENAGIRSHEVQLLRVGDGVDVEDVIDAVEVLDVALMSELATFHGGPNEVPPYGARSVIIELPAGEYVVVCFQGGLAHVSRGMVATMTITEPAAPATPPAPVVAAEITLTEFAMEVVGDLTAGTHWIHVTNDGALPHEVRAYSSGGSAGGSSAIGPGGETWIEMLLEAGSLQVTCHVPDPSGAQRHSDLGMSRIIDVGE